MKTHPRIAQYPYHEDYVRMKAEFRPNILYIQEPNYRSPSANTDKYGLREQYDFNGEFIDLDNLKKVYQQCNVLIGGSTVFGVDSTSDRTTISSKLNQPYIPCINLGIRGATSQHEFIAFNFFKRLLPPIKNIIILSGVNNLSLASLSDSIFYPEFGGLFSEEYFFEQLKKDQYHYFYSENKIAEIMLCENLCEIIGKVLGSKNSFLRKIVRTLLAKKINSNTKIKPNLNFDSKLKLILDLFQNDMHSWSNIQVSGDCKIHFVLQPSMGWCNKPLTKIENDIKSLDIVNSPSMINFFDSEKYQYYKSQIKDICQNKNIEFYDSNQFLDKQYSDKEIFTDVCHLNDFGNELIFQYLLTNLNWK